MSPLLLIVERMESGSLFLNNLRISVQICSVGKLAGRWPATSDVCASQG